jgi:23S rRNA pseudouridine2605 synthase
MQLTKYISTSGLATRREASQLIKDGKVSINGSVMNEPFYLVKEDDVVSYKGKEIHRKEEFVYFLVNKPKDVSTKTDDGIHISTLVSKKTTHLASSTEPLDSNDLGLAILTNDQSFIDRLLANHKVKYTYQVFLEKPWVESQKIKNKSDLVVINSGVVPENFVDIETTLSYAELKEALKSSDLAFTKIDRLTFGGLTKKDLPRGWNRPLTEKEIIFLKHFS